VNKMEKGWERAMTGPKGMKRSNQSREFQPQKMSDREGL